MFLLIQNLQRISALCNLFLVLINLLRSDVIQGFWANLVGALEIFLMVHDHQGPF